MERMRLHPGLLLLIWLVVGIGAARPARAEDQPGALALATARSALTQGQIRGSALAFECVGDRVIFETAVHPQRMTSFHLPGPVLDVLSAEPERVQIEWNRSQVTVQPRRRKGDVLTTVRIDTQTCEVHVVLRRAERLEDAPAIVEIRKRDQVAEMLAAVQVSVQALHTRVLRPLEHHDGAARDEPDTLIEGLAVRTDLVPGQTSTEGGPIRLLIERGVWLQDDFYVEFQVDNPTPERLRVSRPHAIDALGTRTDITELSINAPVTRENDGTWAIPPYTRTHGILKLPNARARKIEPLRIAMSEAMTLQTTIATIQDWEIWIPRTPEQVEEAERQKREAERQKREAKEKERVTVHVSGMAGGIWLPQSQTENRLDATSMSGLGAQITYAFNRNWLVETSVTGASTGEAHFDNVSFNGMQGELLRGGWLGRVRIGGALRFGRKVMPIVRAGASVRLTSIDARFLVDDSEVPGPESEVLVDGLWYMGSGVDVRLGEHVVAGLAASYEHGAARAIEAGIHVGYSWKP